MKGQMEKAKRSYYSVKSSGTHRAEKWLDKKYRSICPAASGAGKWMANVEFAEWKVKKGCRGEVVWYKVI